MDVLHPWNYNSILRFFEFIWLKSGVHQVGVTGKSISKLVCQGSEILLLALEYLCCLLDLFLGNDNIRDKRFLPLADFFDIAVVFLDLRSLWVFNGPRSLWKLDFLDQWILRLCRYWQWHLVLFLRAQLLRACIADGWDTFLWREKF